MHSSTYLGTKSSYTAPTLTALTITHVHNKSRLRIIHNVANGPGVDGYLDGKRVLKNFAYKSISDYLEISSGIHQLKVNVADTETSVVNGEIMFLPGKTYTLIVHGSIKDLKTIAPLLLDDDLSCPAIGKAHVRFVHAAKDVPDVDIYAGGSKVFSMVSYGSTGTPTYLPVPAGTVDISVTPANAAQKVLGPLSLRLANGGVYTVIASGLLGDAESPLTALVSEDTKGSCIILMI